MSVLFYVWLLNLDVHYWKCLILNILSGYIFHIRQGSSSPQCSWEQIISDIIKSRGTRLVFLISWARKVMSREISFLSLKANLLAKEITLLVMGLFFIIVLKGCFHSNCCSNCFLDKRLWEHLYLWSAMLTASGLKARGIYLPLAYYSKEKADLFTIRWSSKASDFCCICNKIILLQVFNSWHYGFALEHSSKVNKWTKGKACGLDMSQQRW